MPRPRGAGAAAVTLCSEDCPEDHTRSLGPLQDSCEHLQAAAIYAARALAQLRSIADRASCNLWRAEYSLCERVTWPKVRR